MEQFAQQVVYLVKNQTVLIEAERFSSIKEFNQNHVKAVQHCSSKKRVLKKSRALDNLLRIQFQNLKKFAIELEQGKRNVYS